MYVCTHIDTYERDTHTHTHIVARKVSEREGQRTNTIKCNAKESQLHPQNIHEPTYAHTCVCACLHMCCYCIPTRTQTEI